MTTQQLREQSEKIRNERTRAANTANRIGAMLNGIIDYLDSTNLGSIIKHNRYDEIIDPGVYVLKYTNGPAGNKRGNDEILIVSKSQGTSSGINIMQTLHTSYNIQKRFKNGTSWSEWVNNAEVVQSMGNSTTDVMSQAAVTEELSIKINSSADAIYSVSGLNSCNIIGLWGLSCSGELADMFGQLASMVVSLCQDDSSMIQQVIFGSNGSIWSRIIENYGSTSTDIKPLLITGTTGNEHAISIGLHSRADIEGVALGTYSGSKNKGVAVGFGANSDSYGVSIGGEGNNRSTSASENAVAIGSEAEADTGAVAIGSQSYSEPGAIALGSGSLAKNNSIVIGSSEDISENSILIGNNLQNSDGQMIAIGSDSGGSDSICIGRGSEAIDSSVVIGDNAKSIDGESVVVGSHSIAGRHSAVLGREAVAAEESVAVGYTASCNHNKSVSIGFGSESMGDQSISIGVDAEAGDDAVAIGEQCVSSGVAIGSRSVSSRKKCIAIGSKANANATTDSSNIIQIGEGVNSVAQSLQFSTIYRIASRNTTTTSPGLTIKASDYADRTLRIGVYTEGQTLEGLVYYEIVAYLKSDGTVKQRFVSGSVPEAQTVITWNATTQSWLIPRAAILSLNKYIIEDF